MEQLYIPEWFQEEIKKLTNDKGMHTFIGREEDLIVVSALLGYPKLKDMNAEQIVKVLEQATLKYVKL